MRLKRLAVASAILLVTVACTGTGDRSSRNIAPTADTDPAAYVANFPDGVSQARLLDEMGNPDVRRSSGNTALYIYRIGDRSYYYRIEDYVVVGVDVG